jgi:hypothetical protein
MQDDIETTLCLEARDEVLREEYPGRGLSSFGEGDTHRLHETVSQRVHMKRAGLAESKALDAYYLGSRTP